MTSFEDALRDQGYQPIICIGFKEDGEDYRIKVASHSLLKSLSPETWGALMMTIYDAMEKIYVTPMDDLEVRSHDEPR